MFCFVGPKAMPKPKPEMEPKPIPKEGKRDHDNQILKGAKHQILKSI